jgi:FlaA1/EpsC-like NDP-sugar epimerase
MTYDFSGKVVLITGGTGALGRACLEDEVVGSNPASFIFVDLAYYGIELRLF